MIGLARVFVKSEDPKFAKLEMRLEKMDSDEGFKNLQAELEQDLAAFESFRVIKPEGNKAESLETRLKRQLDRAGRILERFKRQQTEMSRLTEVDERGQDKIGHVRAIVERALFSLGPVFTKVADLQTIGLSPAEEESFWSVIKEMFDDVAEWQRAGRGGDQTALDKQRLRVLNENLHIYKKEIGPDGKKVARLLRGSATLPKGEQIQNCDQLFAKAKDDARSLVELRQKLRQTFAIMGKGFDKAVRAEYEGDPYSDRLDKVNKLNGILRTTQDKVVKKLQTTDAAFKEALGARPMRELKWRQEADKPLIEKVRAAMYAELQLGSSAEIDRTELNKLMTVVEETEEVAIGEAAAEVAANMPYLRTLLNRRATNEEETKRFVQARKLWERFKQAVRLREVQDALLTALQEYQPEAGKETDLTENAAYFIAADEVVSDCERLRQLFGDKWLSELGLAERVEKVWQINPVLTEAVDKLGKEARVRFVDNLGLIDTKAGSAALIKMIPAGAHTRFTELGITKETVLANLVYYAVLPNGTTNTGNLVRGLKRLFKHLEGSTATGMDLLKQAGIGEAVTEDGEVVYVIYTEKLNSVYADASLDAAAATA